LDNATENLIKASDDLHKTGLPKDGKHAQPQIVLGLLVNSESYPLAYSIDEGNKYEGHTMLLIPSHKPIAKLWKSL
jgi:transposase